MLEEQLLRNRFIELANRAYEHNRYTFTSFLNQAEINLLCQTMKGIGNIPFTLEGGYENSERKMAGFGAAETLGYDCEFPMTCVLAEPLMKKFADDFSHRDFLGALMNLGIERSTIGDIVLSEERVYIFCTETIADFLCENLKKVKHTHMKCCRTEKLPEQVFERYEELEEIVSSERIDAVLAKISHMSRSQSLELFREKKVFVNSVLCESNDYLLKKGDVLSARGIGKMLYEGVVYRTKKDKLRIRIKKYV